MAEVQKTIKVQVSQKEAFNYFVHDISNWWPPEYTWSKSKLVEMKISPEKDGLCTEIGPHGFRCDWGKVTEIAHPSLISLKWQISPKREPVPDPEKASNIQIRFSKISDTVTQIELKHFNFDNHGEGAKDYHKAMNSEYGWAFILKCFKRYCEYA